jgi:hypothetical protein
MAVKYKLWLHVERIDEEADKYDDIDMPEELGCSESEETINHLAEDTKNWSRVRGEMLSCR